MRLGITHTTRYRFDQPAQYGLQQLRKTPKSTPYQNVLDWVTRIEGGKRELSYEDHHKNLVELISFDRDATELVITSEGLVLLQETNGVVGPHRGPTPLWLYARPTPRTRAGAACRKLLRTVEGDGPIPQLHALMAAVGDAITYEVGRTDSAYTAEDALEAGHGVCQDHAHAFIACAREMGFPARYVSGYLLLHDRTEQDAMHAWAEAHVDALGWVGFDPANVQSPDHRYVRVATGLDYAEAAPVTGMRMGGGGESMHVAIAVQQQ